MYFFALRHLYPQWKQKGKILALVRYEAVYKQSSSMFRNGISVSRYVYEYNVVVMLIVFFSNSREFEIPFVGRIFLCFFFYL